MRSSWNNLIASFKVSKIQQSLKVGFVRVDLTLYLRIIDHADVQILCEIFIFRSNAGKNASAVPVFFCSPSSNTGRLLKQSGAFLKKRVQVLRNTSKYFLAMPARCCYRSEYTTAIIRTTSTSVPSEYLWPRNCFQKECFPERQTCSTFRLATYGRLDYSNRSQNWIMWLEYRLAPLHRKLKKICYSKSGHHLQERFKILIDWRTRTGYCVLTGRRLPWRIRSHGVRVEIMFRSCVVVD